MPVKFVKEEKDPQKLVPPTLYELVRTAIQAATSNFRVCVPATVVTYDHKKQVIDAKPAFKRKNPDGTISDPPIIYNVPVAFPRAGDAYIALPLAKGDNVLLLFSDHSLEKWQTSGGEVYPDDEREHHISDAIAVPGCYPLNNSAKIPNNKDLIIKNGNIEIRFKKNGHLQILNGKHDLMKIFDEWIEATAVGATMWLFDLQDRLRTFMER